MAGYQHKIQETETGGVGTREGVLLERDEGDMGLLSRRPLVLR